MFFRTEPFPATQNTSVTHSRTYPGLDGPICSGLNIPASDAAHQGRPILCPGGEHTPTGSVVYLVGQYVQRGGRGTPWLGHINILNHPGYEAHAPIFHRIVCHILGG